MCPVPIDPSGQAGPTRGQANGPRWQKTSHGLYVSMTVDRSLPEQRILEQSMRLSGGAVTGWASCRMHRANFFDGLRRDGLTPLPVPLNCGPLHQIRRLAGDDLIRDILNPGEIVSIAGVPCTVVLRATFDAMRYAPSAREAVVALDMMAAAARTSIRRMREYVEAHPAWTGVQRARDAIGLADELGRSPQETRLRLMWQLDAGRPRPLVNPPLFDRQGRLLGYPDLIDVEAGVVGEYDGEDHRDAIRHSHDVGRESTFRDHDLEVLRVTGPDMRNVQLVCERIHSAFRRARRVPPARRSWTLDPPSWWPAQATLDQLLDLRDRADPTGLAAS